MTRGNEKGRRGLGRACPALAALSCVVLLGGCYAYTAVEPEAAPVGSDVRIRVRPDLPLQAGTVPLEGRRAIRGKLLASSSRDTLLCSVPLDPDPTGPSALRLEAALPVPTRAVESIELRRLDRTRTGLLVGAGAALTWVVLDAAFDIRGNAEGTDGPGGVDNARITLLRLRW